ncbi:Channel protein VirB8 (plasmid) [Roseomonas mucosa]|uniref:virB8 family protein n=1 Tax=Roseomonas mucosa TaxID=207340 RepID=UPI0022479D6F|nr:VirB8/TrbF family protein [Roseomonas mucosa]UZO95025.1 Channel protein VirB8 [Roseomonas mucosa]
MVRSEAPEGAMFARQVPDDPALLKAYFENVASYQADRVKWADRRARAGVIYGTIGLLVGLAGVVSTASLAPFKTVEALVFRVDEATGAVERVYDVRGGQMAATDASTRYFLWQYVRLRQSFAAPEAQASFDAVALMSAPIVQNQYAAEFRGSNPNSPQVILGRDGTASVRWVSTSMLGPKLAQVRFVQLERKGDTALPPKRMIATIAFDYSPGQLSSSALNVNPLGFVVTSYRADQESTQ